MHYSLSPVVRRLVILTSSVEGTISTLGLLMIATWFAQTWHCKKILNKDITVLIQGCQKTFVISILI
jgi:hypothetical protein